MKKKGRRCTEQIIRILRACEGMKVEDAWHEHALTIAGKSNMGVWV